MSKLRGPGKRFARKSGGGFLVESLECRTLLTTLPVLTVNGTSGNDSISLSNSGVFQFQVSLNSVITKYLYTSYSGVQINGVGGNDTINILAIGLPTTVVGAGQDAVTLGDSNGVQDITAQVTITDPPSYVALTVDDSGDTTGRNATISNTSITNLGPAAINYHPADLSSLTINGGSGGNTFTVTNTPEGLGTTPTTLNSGSGSDLVNIQGTTSNTALYLQGQSGDDTVNITNAGSAQGIQGALNIKNDGGFDALTVDDSADTTPRTATFSTFIPGGDTAWESVTGLAAASIDYRGADMNSETFDGGSGGNAFNVFGIVPGSFPIPTNLNTGNGNDTVNIFDTSANTVLNVQGVDGVDTVNVGDGNSVHGIQGILYIENTGGFDALTIDDSADSTSQTATFDTYTPAGDSAWESLTGLAPGAINWELADISTATVNGGTSGNTFNVNNIGAGGYIDLNSGNGADQVNILASAGGTTLNVQGQNGADAVDVSNAGSVQGILGTVNLQNTAYFNTVTINDSADTISRTATLSTGTPQGQGGNWGSVSGLAPGTVNFKDTDTANPITIDGGTGGNTFNVTGIVDQTALNSGTGPDLVNIMAIPGGTVLYLDGQSSNDTVNVGNAGSVQGIQGTVDIKNTGADDTLTIDDSADPSAENATLGSILIGVDTYESLTGLTMGTINFLSLDMLTVTINAGSGANTFNIDALLAGSFESYVLNTGTNNDTINVHATDAAAILTVNTQGGSDTINLDFTSGNPLPELVNLNGLFTITGFIVGENLNNTTLNLNRSTVYIYYGSHENDPLALIQGYLKTGYNNGAWNGTAGGLTGAISSSPAEVNPNHTTAIGYADSADGHGIDTRPNTIELTYTLYGDANLDHQVNSSDLQILLFNLNRPGAWDQGDFNYDAQVNSADLQRLLFNLNTSLGSQAVPAATATAQAPSSTIVVPPLTPPHHKASHDSGHRKW